MHKSQKIIVTIPAYNEESTIGNVLKQINSVMQASKYNYKIIVVDDGSNDKTRKISSENGAIVYSHPTNLGLAEAFRTEIKKCLELKADIIVHTDADGQYTAKDIPKMIDAIQEGYDLVLGDRFSGGIESMPLIKKIGNRAFSRAITKLLKFKVNDCQTGFRAFTREIAEQVPIISDHTYTQEQIITASRKGFKIKEIPTYFSARKDKSRLISNPLNYAIKAWINILRIQRDYNPLKFFGTVALGFIFAGIAIGIWLFATFIKTGIVGHLPSTILCVLLIITGLQILFFGFLADMHKRQQ